MCKLYIQTTNLRKKRRLHMKSSILFLSAKLTRQICEQTLVEVYTFVDIHFNILVKTQTWSIVKTNLFQNI